MHHTMFHTFFVLMFSLATLFLGMPSTAQAQNVQYTMRLGATQGMDMAYVRSLREIAAAIQQRSGGQIKVEILLGGEAGSEISMVKNQIEGRLEGAFISASTLSQTIPAYAMLLTPRLFVTPNQLLQFIGSRNDQRLRRRAMRKQLQVLGYGGTGFYGILSRGDGQWQSMQENKDVVRTPSVPVHQDGVEAMGLRASYVPVGEISKAISNDWLQGISSTPELLDRTRLLPSFRHFYPTRHIYGWMVFTVSNRWYANLPKELRKVVREAADAVLRHSFSYSLKVEQKLLNQWSAGSGPALATVPERALAEQLQPWVGEHLQKVERAMRLHNKLWRLWIQNNGLDEAVNP
uniref:Putative TRAP dicarboxylate transporter-DctP subunit n=1 Tax=Magnetococcus massalia (strain MO-1) TaxID=451514 RepID=A0A1S7LMX5_MAGMO|nr:putative TRAP dicarboxylate transporter-DctP subunit [Candidatus Magnetococcus massalia]